MSLPSQVAQFPFRMGLAEGTDPKQAPPGSLTRAENVTWTKTGLLEKRSGTRTLPVLPTGIGKRLFTRGDELCANDGTSILSLKSDTAVAWSTVAAIPDVGLTWAPLLDPIAGAQASDTSVSGDFVVTAIVPGDPTTATASGVSVFVSSLATGALLMPLTALTVAALAYGVRVIVIGNSAIIIASGADATIRAWNVDLTTFVVTGAFGLKADRNNATFQNWDARNIAGSSLFVLAYDTTAAGIRTVSYDASLVVQQSALDAASLPSPTKLAVAGTSGESICVVGFTNTVLVRAQLCDATTMATTGVITVDATGVAVINVGVCRYDATNYAVVYTRNPAAGATVVNQVNSRMVTSAAALVANSRRATAGTGLISNPFMVYGKCYAFAQNAAGAGSVAALAAPYIGNACILLNIFPGADDGTSVATDLTHPLVGVPDTLLGAYNSFRTCLPVFLPVSTTRLVGSLPFIGTAPSNQLTWRCGLRLLNVTAGADVPTDLWRAINRGPETFISGSVESVYDGGDVFDYGFNYAPSMISQVTAGAGGVVLAGAYIYATHPEYRAASGLLFRGPTVVGPPLTTAGATSLNTLRFANYNVGNKKHAQIERFTSSLPVYRTIANGTIPQRLTEEPTFNLSPLTYSASSLTYADGRGDAAIDTSAVPPTLASRPALYTSGGILDDQPCPSNVTTFAHVDRLWVLAGDRRVWWYSKAFNDDVGTAPGFNVAFRIIFDTEQVAGASMDDKAIFFSVSGIRYMPGVGPGPNGQNSDFQAPTQIQTDTGCTNPRSVVSMPDGIMFQGTADGIYLLSRQLDVQWIGRPVQDQLHNFPVITSAVMIPVKNEVRFTCNNTAGTAGIVLVYNTQEKQWTTFFYTAGGVASSPIADACLWQDTWTFLTPGGFVYLEDDTTYLDGGATWVTMDVETAEVYAQGPLSAQRVRRVYLKGDLLTSCDVRLRVAIGGSASYDQDKLVTSATMQQLGTAKVGVHVRRQRCDSIRFRVTDAAPVGVPLGTGAGINLSAIGFEIAPMPGLDRRTAEATR